MMDPAALHQAAREIFAEALKSVDAGEAVRREVSLQGSRLKIVKTTLNLTDGGAGIYAVALGKAARPMASALTEILGDRLRAGVAAAPPTGRAQQSIETAKQPPASTQADIPFALRWRVFEGGHPLPNRESLDAARAAFGLLKRANLERSPVIFLISGGGSALMEWPRDEATTLEELQAANEALVTCGADISEINSVRRALSAVKGGGLARLAPRCDQVSLIVSDTGAGRESIVASGPTFAPLTDAPDAESVVARYNLEARLPESVLRAIRNPVEKAQPAPTRPLREYYVLLDNESALARAAEAASERGLAVKIARDVVEQPIIEGCSGLLSRLLDLSRRTGTTRRGACLISGGEFTCPVRGSGTGGRNSESALRWAIELDALADKQPGLSHAVALSAGTDGIDGNSPAAGAISDETTIRRARQLNLDAHRFLEESNAYTFFQALKDAIITGPTGTNVRDLRIMLAR